MDTPQNSAPDNKSGARNAGHADDPGSGGNFVENQVEGARRAPEDAGQRQAEAANTAAAADPVAGTPAYGDFGNVSSPTATGSPTYNAGQPTSNANPPAFKDEEDVARKAFEDDDPRYGSGRSINWQSAEPENVGPRAERAKEANEGQD